MEISIAGVPRPRLERWEHRMVWPAIAAGPGAGDHRDHSTRQVGREPPGPPTDGGPHRRVAAAILRYDVFPPALVTGLVRRAPVAPGDTVGILYHLAPRVELFFAARVTARFDGGDGALWRTGFTYHTIVGHPEMGEETFSVEKDLASGVVMVVLRAWSRPGTLLARAFAPLVRRLQVHATEHALEHLADVARSPAR